MSGKKLIFLLLFNLLACQSIQAAMNIHAFEAPDASHIWENSASNTIDSSPETETSTEISTETSTEKHCEHCSSCHSHLSLPSALGLGKHLSEDTLRYARGHNNDPKKRIELILRPPKASI